MKKKNGEGDSKTLQTTKKRGLKSKILQLPFNVYCALKKQCCHHLWQADAHER